MRSAFAVRYNTVLNLWDPPDGDRVRNMLQQSLAQYQAGQRIRQLEDDIIEIGGDIIGARKGCLIGLPNGDDLLEDYRLLIGTRTTAEQKERRIAQQVADIERSLESAPWPEPGRQALRKVLRTANPGLIVHDRSRGWGVYLARCDTGVGLFLFDRSIQIVPEYRSIDYVFDQRIDKVPEALTTVDDSVEDVVAGKLVTGRQLSAFWTRVRKLGLPDLAAMRREHRRVEEERVAHELAGVAQALEETREQLDALDRAREEHPCHTCTVRKEHRDNLRRVDNLEKERSLLEGVLERETDAEEARIRGVIRGIREVLNRFGYLYRGYPTEKADMLASVFDNDALILCELVDRGVLDGLLPEDLAEVFSWFSFDRDFRYANHFTLSRELIALRRRLADIERAVLGEERDNGLYISEGHNPSFYGAARAWTAGQTMVEICEQIELSEGDLVLTFNKTIDLLRQVREMLTDVLPEHPLRFALRDAERLIRRDIVEQSLTLGFAPLQVDDVTPEEVREEPLETV